MSASEHRTLNVGSCGLVCSACVHATEGCTGCDDGGGDPDCHQRVCTANKAIEGCWQCESFPCDVGYFATAAGTPGEAWRGLCVASVQLIRELGAERFERLIGAAHGTIDYGVYRHRSPCEMRAILAQPTGD
jgi:hypothetical protein